MYEKPQYLTPDGYKRLPKNPFGEKNISKSISPRPDLQKEAEQRALLKKKIQSRKIDPKAAKLIAEAIKTMLRQE